MKMPPKIKIYEALSALASNNIEMNENKAKVYSSDKSKDYLVEFKDDEYSSNDNATYWQGYSGYPIIAVLMLQKRLKYNENILQYFKDINWKKINTKFKNDYQKSIEFALSSCNIDTLNLIYNEIDNIYNDLEKMNITIKKSRLYPPS